MDTRELNFEAGCARFDFDTEVIRFDGTDSAGAVRCAISREAFDDFAFSPLAGVNIQDQVATWEFALFNIARVKHQRGERQADGSIVIGVGDVGRLSETRAG